MADAFGDYPRKYLPEKPGEVRESLNVDTKAFNMLGWKPKGDIITYIKRKLHSRQMKVYQIFSI